MLEVEQTHHDAKEAIESRLKSRHPYIWRNLCGISVGIITDQQSGIEEVGVRIDLHPPKKPRSLDRVIKRTLGKTGLSDIPVSIETGVPYAELH